MKKRSSLSDAGKARIRAGIKHYWAKKKAENGNGAITDAMPNFDATIEERVRQAVRKKVLAVLDDVLPA